MTGDEEDKVRRTEAPPTHNSTVMVRVVGDDVAAPLTFQESISWLLLEAVDAGGGEFLVPKRDCGSM